MKIVRQTMFIPFNLDEGENNDVLCGGTLITGIATEKHLQRH